jgi:hypothetical protein
MGIMFGAMKFRSKPLEIEAMLYDGSNTGEIVKWIGSDLCYPWAVETGNPPSLAIVTPEGVRRANQGDWIICGGLGVFYPFNADLFEAKFERAEGIQRGQTHAAVRY